MALKVILDFELEGYGWSEVHYVNLETIAEFIPSDNNWTTGISPAANLFIVRRECLVSEARIVHMRVSNMALAGSFMAHDYSGDASFGKYISFDNVGSEAETFESILVNLTSGSVARRRLYVAGIPDEVVSGSQIYKPTAGFRNVLALYLSFVSKSPFCVRSRPRPLGANVKVITAFATEADGKHATMTPIFRPVDLPEQWYVIVRGLKGPAGWNGVHRATLAPAGGAMILGPTRRPLPAGPAFAQTAAATVAVMAPVLVALDKYDTVRIVSKRRGRPFGKSRGRR